MKVLIIGGTGFIGSYVTRRLSETGHTVTVFHRGRTGLPLPSNVDSIQGDRHQLAQFRAEFTHFNPDVVVDMVPLVEADAHAVLSTFRNITGRVVIISSQDVYHAYGILNGSETGPLQPVPISEDSALRSVLYPYRSKPPRELSDPRRWLDDYDKIPIEQLVMHDSQLAGTVLRLPMVFGPGDKQHRLFEILKRMDDHRPAILLETGYADWQWTRGYVENIAAGIALAIVDDRAAERIYNLGEPEALSMRQWVEVIGKVVGWEGRIIVAPVEQLPPHLAEGANTSQHLITDTSRIRQELGYQEQISREEALERTILWERTHPPQFSAETFDYQAEDQALEKLT